MDPKNTPEGADKQCKTCGWWGPKSPHAEVGYCENLGSPHDGQLRWDDQTCGAWQESPVISNQ